MSAPTIGAALRLDRYVKTGELAASLRSEVEERAATHARRQNRDIFDSADVDYAVRAIDREYHIGARF